jgi:hypothetical protein
MKISKLILIAFVALTGFISCKKDKAEKPTSAATIEGRWVGTYVNDASGNSFYYSLNIKNGGVIEELSAAGQKLGQGTWKLENNILSAKYSSPGGSGFSILAAFNKEQGKLLGDWGYGNSATNGGTWEMHKQN